MYLKALEIQGFKSFPDKTVLNFGEDITAIVGPNGSGKSNISDAVRWVMGEQSTKALRGGKMEDVIFGGTARRKQLGYAEVSLVLDNADHIFPLEESEVMVTRRYYRSGESEYYINRRSVRLKDVNELFMDTGLGREGYSIIGQGKIDEILSVKSADRREVFEEAAGISRFRHRKEEAERKLERTQENLVRITDKIDELELQVEPLRGQAEKAKKFLIYRDELRGLEISLWLEQLERLRASAIKILSDYENAVRQKEEAQEQVQALYAAAEEFTAQMREKDVQAEGVRFEMMQRQADANGLDSEIAVLRTNIRNNLDNAGRIQQELEQQAGRADTITGQIDAQRERLAALTGEIEALAGELEALRGESEGYARSAGALEQALEGLREKQAIQSACAAEARALLSALAAAAQEIYDRDAGVRQALAAEEERAAALEESRSAARAELEQAREERDSLENTVRGYALRLEKRRQKAEQAGQRKSKLEVEHKTLAARRRMLSDMERMYEGYSKAVKRVMEQSQQGRLEGIHGPVAGLIHVPDPYAVAIEIALGGAMQHVVVDSPEQGKAAIGYLKRTDAGRCTFLPLTTIRPSEFRERDVDKQPGFVGMGDALISFEPRYAKIFSSLLGRTVIAENLDAAIAMAGRYAHRFKIVTLDGQVLNPGGSMTGGSASRSAGILSRANELERLKEQDAALVQELQQAVKEEDDARREASAASYELDTAKAQQREQENIILKLEERCTQLDSQLEQAEGQRAAHRAELEQLQARSAQTEEDTKAARARIEELEGETAALQAEAEGKASGRADLEEKNRALAQRMSAVSVSQAALEAERGTLEESVAQLEALRRDLTGDRGRREEMVAGFQAENAALEAEIARKQAQLETIRAREAEGQQDIARLNEERLALEGQRNQADRDSREKNTQLLAMEREVSVLEQKKVAAALEEKSLLDKLWETYELSHEAARAQRVELESTAKAQRRVGELKRAISALGSINLGAIEEFDRVNERYTYLTAQRDDVQTAKGELEGIIAKITEEMRGIFAQQFQVINEAFQQTFTQLFGGGRARLELEDEGDILNCGIEIKVQPPGKALKVLSLLSGGEKAFVAIALYFAILKVRPTPFCVMDEIEAALDDANVTRFAHYLRQMADKTQFIVITHRRGTMEEADVLYGVTMQEQGISRILTINLNDVEKELHIK